MRQRFNISWTAVIIDITIMLPKAIGNVYCGVATVRNGNCGNNIREIIYPRNNVPVVNKLSSREKLTIATELYTSTVGN